MEEHKLILYTEFRRFYLIDTENEALAMMSLGEFSKDEWKAQLKVARSGLAIITAREGDTHVTIEIHSSNPLTNYFEWDHVVEASLEVKSGSVLVMSEASSESDSTIIKIPPACYRIRIHYAGLSIENDTMADSGEDFYLVTLWPSLASDTSVIKQYEYVP